MPVGADGYPEALHRAFAAHGPSVELDVSLGGHHVRVRFGDEAMAGLLSPALRHLAPVVGGSDPSLTIDAWDWTSFRADPLPSPWRMEQYGAHGRVLGLDERELRAHYEVSLRLLSVYRPRSGRGAYAVGAARTIPRWVVRMPFRHLLGWWGEDVGLSFVHAAAVGRGGACVLLPGASESGKSTTSLAASEAGLDFLADDLVLVDVPAATAFAPYGWAKAEADAVARLPGLAARILSTEEGQSMLRPANLVGSARVVGLLLPRVTGGRTTSTRPATAPEALRALAPSTLVENVGGSSSLASLVRLARCVPAAHLDLGTDMVGVAAAVDEVLQRWSR